MNAHQTAENDACAAHGEQVPYRASVGYLADPNCTCPRLPATARETETARQIENRIGLWRSLILDPNRDPLAPLDVLLDSFEADVRAHERTRPLPPAERNAE